MPYQFRSNRRVVKNAKKRFIYAIIFCLFLLYATVAWILPWLIGGVSSINKKFKDPLPVEKSISEDTTMAPPVLTIPYESTNSAEIDIHGYSTPGSDVEIYVNEALAQTTPVDPDGSFNAANVSLDAGENMIYGKTVNDKKQSLPSKTLTISLNNSKPKLIISEPENGKEITGDDKKVNISGKTDPESRIYINEGQIIVSKDGTFTTSLPLNDGDNTIIIKAVNGASTTTETELKIIYKPEQSSPSSSPAN